MGEAKRRGSKEDRKALAIFKNELICAEIIKQRHAEWDNMTLEERAKYHAAAEYISAVYALAEPYIRFLNIQKPDLRVRKI